MFLKIDKLPVELPMSPDIDPIAARNVQELLGGRFGEMSTLMNYTFQAFNMKGKDSIKPYYSLISNIAAEEGGHIEIVSAAINALLNGPRTGFDASGDPLGTPLQGVPGMNPHHYIVGGPGALCQDSRGNPWTGDNVFSSGNLILDLLHNFFLENGARFCARGGRKTRTRQTRESPQKRAAAT